MYSTKRKFQSLLNSITGSPRPTDSPTISHSQKSATAHERLGATAEVESHAKRRRITPTSPSKAYATRDTVKGTSTRNGVQLDATTEPKRASPPNYAPWDRAQFLERLKTFRHVDRWTSKPDHINEVQWARRGWTCIGKERLGCVGGCGNELWIQLESRPLDYDNGVEEDEDDSWLDRAGEFSYADLGDELANGLVEEKMAEMYLEKIITGHDEDCLWRRRGCDAGIYQLPLNQPAMAIGALKSRYRSIVEMRSDLPPNIVFPATLNISQLTEMLPPDFCASVIPAAADGRPPSRQGPIDKDAIALAIFGWQAESDRIKGLITCTACFRRLGLWLFMRKRRPPSHSNSLGEDDEEEAPMSSLHVLEQHRDYCPWINAATQNGRLDAAKFSNDNDDEAEEKAGWEVLVRVLNTAHRLRLRSDPMVQSLDQAAVDDGAHPSSIELIEVADDAARDLKDKARWSKLKNLKRAFDVKHHQRRIKDAR